MLPLRVTITEILPKEEKDDEEILPDVREMSLRKMKRFEFADLYDSREYTLEVRVGTSR